MVREINLPFTEETCEKIKAILFMCFLFTGPIVLCVSLYELYFNINNFNRIQCVLVSIGMCYGIILTTIITVLFLPVVIGIISDFYDDHKIIFKCKCDSEEKK